MTMMVIVSNKCSVTPSQSNHRRHSYTKTTHSPKRQHRRITPAIFLLKGNRNGRGLKPHRTSPSGLINAIR